MKRTIGRKPFKDVQAFAYGAYNYKKFESYCRRLNLPIIVGAYGEIVMDRKVTHYSITQCIETFKLTLCYNSDQSFKDRFALLDFEITEKDLKALYVIVRLNP